MNLLEKSQKKLWITNECSKIFEINQWPIDDIEVDEKSEDSSRIKIELTRFGEEHMKFKKGDIVMITRNSNEGEFNAYHHFGIGFVCEVEVEDVGNVLKLIGEHCLYKQTIPQYVHARHVELLQRG